MCQKMLQWQIFLCGDRFTLPVFSNACNNVSRGLPCGGLEFVFLPDLHIPELCHSCRFRSKPKL